MKSTVLFAPMDYTSYNVTETLPVRFKKLLDASGIQDIAAGKTTAIKMHVGRNMGFTTIHPLFVKILVDHLKDCGAKVFITDQEIDSARSRGYAEDFLNVPILDVCGFMKKYYYEKNVDYLTFKNVDVAGHIHDAEIMINLSHIKGHGACGFGGAVKNIAMGCVTDRTRSQIHRLEGGLVWDEDKCTQCEQCIESCNHSANSFKKGKYHVFYHNCTFCQHCAKVCPTGAIQLDANHYDRFQTGMAVCTKTVLDTFEPKSVYYISVLTNITAICDCWGLSTPAIVPDIGIMSSDDIVAIERAALDAIKVENLIPNGLPSGMELGSEGHLFERIHRKNPFIQLHELEKLGLGSQEYVLQTIK